MLNVIATDLITAVQVIQDYASLIFFWGGDTL